MPLIVWLFQCFGQQGSTMLPSDASNSSSTNILLSFDNSSTRSKYRHTFFCVNVEKKFTAIESICYFQPNKLLQFVFANKKKAKKTHKKGPNCQTKAKQRNKKRMFKWGQERRENSNNNARTRRQRRKTQRLYFDSKHVLKVIVMEIYRFVSVVVIFEIP